MSKNIKTTALVLVLLLAFLCGFGLGKNRGFHVNFNNNPYGTTAPADKSDAAPADATAATAEPDDAPAAPDKPQKALKAPKGTEAVVAAFNKAVNRSKRAETVTIEKTAVLELQPGEVQPGLAKGAAQAALKNSLRPGTETHSIRADKDAVTAKDVLDPLGKAAKLDPEKVLAAKAKAKDGGYVIVIKLKPETASFDGEKTRQAKGHAACLTLPDPAELRAFGVKVKAAKLQYTATAIRAEVNGSGLVTKLQYTVPFSAGLMGKYFLFHLDAAVDGTYEQIVTLTY